MGQHYAAAGIERRLTFPLSRVLAGSFVFAIFAALVLVLLSHHEVFRDEMRALSIVRSVQNPVSLLRTALVHEGHPSLWYILLWIGNMIWRDAAILKVVSYLVALAFAVIVIFWSPFPLWQRSLFLFGILPFHCYSVVSRSYGLSMLFLFLLAVIYSSDRHWNPWAAGVCNALLANTCVFATLIACAFLFVPAPHGERSARARGIVITLTALGLLLFMYTVWPDASNLIVNRGGRSLTMGKAAQAMKGVLLDDLSWTSFILTGCRLRERIAWAVGEHGAAAFGAASLLGIFLLFIPKPAMLVSVALVFLAMGLFSRMVYVASEIHVGLLFAFLFTLIWIARSRAGSSRTLYWRLVMWLLGLSLFAHAVMGVRQNLALLKMPYSQSKSAGMFLATNFPDAIVMADPDYYAESLPYYTGNEIYIAREKRFGTYVRWEKQFNRSLTLSELMDDADSMQQETGRTVIVSLRLPIQQIHAGILGGGYGRNLVSTSAEIDRFTRDFAEVKRFVGGMSETYVFYMRRAVQAQR